MRRGVVAAAAMLAFAATAAPATAYYRSESATTVRAVVAQVPAPVPAPGGGSGSLVWRVPAEVLEVQLERESGGTWVPAGSPARCGRAEAGFRRCSTTTASVSTPAITPTAVPTPVPTPRGTAAEQPISRYRARSVVGTWSSVPSSEVRS